MNRDWIDFKSLHSNIAGARESFENACEMLFRKIHSDKSVSQVKVKLGDGGIDIFIGELGIEPITVIQCKFFLESFENSQKSQIRDSFDTAITSTKYELKEWILCIPRVIDIDEHSWWFKWKDKKIKQHNKSKTFITIKNGNELITLFKEQDLYNQIFNIADSLKIDEIHKALMPKKIALPTEINPQIVLFNNYSKKCESFYLERELDVEFTNSLKLSNLWVSGGSGLGKTALVNRNLTNNNVEYCYCDLSPVTISASEDVLEEILCRIEEQFILERNSNEKNKIKQIAQILRLAGRRKIIIVIDELSVDDKSILKNIAKDLLNLVTHFSSFSEHDNLKFVVSTISNPKDIIENKSKASEHFQYLNCDDWSSDLERLYDILNISLNINLIEKYKIVILDSSQYSPRILKNIFRKIVALDDLSSTTIETAIKISISEIVN
ncbi:hypothetical protein [Flavobacterium sp. DSR3-2]|uniref:hypothetical protein n=1 Tax=Flavobacterium sp. DSR3-2 TaxID=2804634 RepID=UPI003CE8F46B